MSIGLDISAKVIMTQEKLLKSLDRAELKTLKRVGALVRRRMRSSLRRRKKVAAAGKPPSIHSKHKFLSLKNIRFAVDGKNKSVIVGPIKLRNSKAKGRNTVPEILEFGKTGVVTDDKGNEHAVKYDKFPFAGPALDAELAEGSLLESMEDSLLP